MRTRIRAHLFASTMLVAGVAVPAHAQTAEDARTQAPEATANEQPVIVVTGSRISNPNLDQSSPVQVVGESEITLRQATNAEELIGELPGVSPGAGAGVNNGGAGFASLNLRGVGTNRNLVLLDGTRLVPSSLLSETDLNIIPVALVERVEIVTGGASSVYGADAIAGVANFITKKDFAGAELAGTLGINERGDGARYRADVTLGANFDDGRGNAVLNVGYQKVEPVLQGDRDVSRNTYFINGEQIGSGTTFPTRINGRIYNPETDSLRDYVGSRDAFNFAPDNYFQTPLERYNLFGSARYEIADAIEVYAKGMFTKSTVQLSLAPSGMFGDTWLLPLNNPFLPNAVRTEVCASNSISAADCAAAAGATDPTDPNYREVATIINRRFVEQGPRIRNLTTNQFQVWAGVRGEITDSIDFDIYGLHGESDRKNSNINWGLKSRVQQALRAVSETECADPSNGCVPINLFGDGTDISPESIAFFNQPAGATISTRLSVVSGSISGEIGNFLAGETPIGYALGAEYRKYGASQVSDVAFGTQDEVLGTGAPSPSFSGAYDVKEVFAEVIVPLVEDVPGIHSLTFEGGLRLSDYSNTGGSTTWKAGGTWEPLRGYKIRGIFQHSVRSPNISELFTPVTTGLSNLPEDPCEGTNPVGNPELTAICIAQGAPAGVIGNIPSPSAGQINLTSGGNPDLGVETADSYTLGVVLTPPQIPRLAVTADYYHIKVTDAITLPTPNDIFGPCFEEGDAEACALIRRNPLNGSLNGGGDTPGLIAVLTNQGTIVTSGVDLRINYDVPMSFGGLNFDLTGNWTEQSKFQASPVGINRECVGQYSSNCGFFAGEITPELSFNFRTTARIDEVGDISLLWRWIDGVDYERILPTDGVHPDYLSIPSYNYLDLTFRTEIADTLGLTFSVQNLLDKDPPNVSNYVGTTALNSGNTYPTTYDVLGRRYSITATMKF
ncbi:TonB-dependent receptor [Pelagerythrobacter aerophilus]|uniref:TonB-dependent receptor n=2 Tax=Pelagerythrobacter aerophilus TaxID=2306995 RepID=A0A418NK73_9SPHN|nr:TonB-dependent receptor [Pelagerythrobacter aerophilus]